MRLQLLCNLGKEMRPKCLLKDAFYCHSERSEESWLGFNPAESDENIRNASHDSSPPAPRNDMEALQHPDLIDENPDSNHEMRGSSNG